jgi:hypothetical protein
LGANLGARFRHRNIVRKSRSRAAIRWSPSRNRTFGMFRIRPPANPASTGRCQRMMPKTSCAGVRVADLQAFGFLEHALAAAFKATDCKWGGTSCEIIRQAPAV